MSDKPTYEELKQRVKELEEKALEWKRTEAVLRESEERYRLFAENMTDIMWIMDMNLRLIHIVTSSAPWTGYSAEEAMGLPLEKFLTQASMEVVIKAFAEELAIEKMRGKDLSRLSRTLELEHVCKDGTTVWAEANMTFLHDSDDQIVGIMGVTRDITERRQAEAALRESVEKYTLLFENVSNVIYSIDREFKVLDISPSVERMMGYSPDELIGKPFPELNVLAPEYLEAALSDTMRVFAGERIGSSVYEFIAKNGERRFGEVSGDPLFRDGQVVAVISVARDITEQRLAEEALAAERERLSDLLDGSPVPTFVIDRDHRVIFWNRPWESLTGMPRKDVMEKPLDLRLLYRDRVPPILAEVVLDTADEDIIERYGEKGVRKSDIHPETFIAAGRRIWVRGEERLINIQATRFRNPQGVVMGAIQCSEDITEQERLKDQLQQARKMEAIGTLAGGIAHDFNNLLTGVQGHISLMLMNINSSHHHFEHLREIESMVRSGADLTAQLLGFARGGKYEVRLTNLNNLLEKSSRMFSRTKKEINIHKKYQEDIWFVEVDQGQIEQVLLNLYVNAWQAMPGGGELYLQTENIVLDEDYVKPFKVELGDYVKVSVTDTGVGMDRETSSRIFEPFFTTREMGRGTGLGLASAYGIIKNHGGIINVYSEKGSGSTFNIYLPASKAVVGDEVAGVSEEQVLRGDETILFVDDEDIIIDIGGEMLEEMGYKVLLARGGKEAIDIYRENMDRIGMVILDMVMPDMGGGKTYDLLKEINPDVKVLLASGYSVNGQATEILERGCNGFIQKPFDMKRMSRAVRDVLDSEGRKQV